MLAAMQKIAAEVATQSDLVEHLLPSMERLLGASQTLLFEFKQPGIPHALGGSLAPLLASYLQGPGHDDPIHSYLAAKPVSRLADLNAPQFDWQQYRRTDAYNLFYKCHDIEHLLAIWPTDHRYGQSGMSGILTARSRQSGPFSTNAYKQLEGLWQSVSQAVARTKKVEALRLRHEVLSNELSRGACADVIFKADGSILWHSHQAAKTILADRTLSNNLRDCAIAYSRSAAANHEGSSIDSNATLSDSQGGFWQAFFHLVRDAQGQESFAAAVVVYSASTCAMTAAERRVLSELARGACNKEIASTLHCSVETVRTHVKRLLGKLGVSNRTEAAIIAQRAGLIKPSSR